MRRTRSPQRVLAGDIGGTKTTLALYASDDARTPLDARTYDSRALEGLDQALADFLPQGPPPTAAALAVAGPVVGDAVQVTNLAWRVSRRELAESLSTPHVVLLNDVEALAGAVEMLLPGDLAALQQGVPDPWGTVAVLALGTGLGMGYVTRDAQALASHVHPSEGGHADFAPANPLQARLLAHLWREFDHVSVERVGSGLGLPRIYRFLVESEGREEDPAIRSSAAADDPTPAIVSAALSGRSATCREAVLLLCDVVAAEAGNLALKLLATGGVYLGGGLAPRLLPFVGEPRFVQAFCGKGRFAPLLKRVPVSIILPPQAVLWGAALRGFAACARG